MQHLTEREPQFTQLQTCENLIASARFDWYHRKITDTELAERIDKVCNLLGQIKQ